MAERSSRQAGADAVRAGAQDAQETLLQGRAGGREVDVAGRRVFRIVEIDPAEAAGVGHGERTPGVGFARGQGPAEDDAAAGIDDLPVAEKAIVVGGDTAADGMK